MIQLYEIEACGFQVFGSGLQDPGPFFSAEISCFFLFSLGIEHSEILSLLTLQIVTDQPHKGEDFSMRHTKMSLSLVQTCLKITACNPENNLKYMMKFISKLVCILIFSYPHFALASFYSCFFSPLYHLLNLLCFLTAGRSWHILLPVPRCSCYLSFR